MNIEFEEAFFFHQRRHKNDQQVYKKIFNITIRENENQKYNER